MEWLTDTLAGFTAMSIWEYIAVVLAVAYLLLAIKENIWCWPVAFINTFIYTVLYWNGALVMESLLHFYYMVMAVVGWWMWRQGNKNAPSRITSWSMSKHLSVIAVTAIVSVVLGYVTKHYMSADLAYLDSFTTCFAVVTTYLVAKKVLENWLYWVVIDAASIYLYYLKGFYPTLVLFIFYTLMACWGYKRWYEEYEAKQGKSLATL
ncbi:nicotinamide riboside transporter PnuC [Pseudoalteromonas peptidolytica]|uniref:Nicotinamide riboside transporter PnuC n=1 Tax=Pseudoalteromonas peptidolytica F12-50-A1 TaxID=1315280 RepID=A0A8I0MSU2_9GAMM|nr:nicotinamide riboside transporter PnuC [Pseudoalteromonas peptidolytica]MBE0345172.1 nicotinamide mononucleotide transporter [Pseudoalteromonas peptidolytica F12-50-A1]NLR14836.1 nicotinamide mononucleotide transporter [Pseudoalteromonas peptidolytica]GEK09790.1 nicotinamide mononucleotide transporter [Pseudoalteromonas peptidolytica]